MGWVEVNVFGGVQKALGGCFVKLTVWWELL